MAHTNYGEVRQLFETFTRVCEVRGKTTLHLHTQDGQARASLDIQLGSPADPRPGAPEVRKDGPGPSHGPQHCKTHTNPRRRGPAARVCDEMRRAAWLQQQKHKQQQNATLAKTTVISHDKNTMPPNILDSSMKQTIFPQTW